MTALLTAAALMANRPLFEDVSCDSWNGTVRMARMSGPDKIRFAILTDTLERDQDQRIKLLSAVNWAFAVDLLAASIVNAEGQLQFADPSARAWLSGEVQAVGQLLPQAMRIQGLGGATADEPDEVDEAKKN